MIQILKNMNGILNQMILLKIVQNIGELKKLIHLMVHFMD